jgi:hypothetical protein
MCASQETLRLAREKAELERQVYALKKQLSHEGKLAAEKVQAQPTLRTFLIIISLADILSLQIREHEDTWLKLATERQEKIEVSAAQNAQVHRLVREPGIIVLECMF